ncbi:hypothetical protein ES703_88194 [subsurface metagenome]
MLPALVPLFIGARLAEEFEFRLLEFACPEDKGLGRYLVAEAFADLGDSERYLDSRSVEHISEIGEDSLGGFGAKVHCH